ncbi:MAG: RIP metalloprotease RseP [Bryobacteraceae bacterium]|nr:RIP metalloprotease RseP [Bryobacteraceae bacterium]
MRQHWNAYSSARPYTFESRLMVVIQNIWWLLVLIGVMILIHELGHFWAARFFDVRVETFSFGFGPRLFGFRRGETDFRFSAILFGGYVKMAGEQPGEETSDPRAFGSKPRWQRLIIAFAGPGMNILLAVALLAGLFMVRYPRLANSDLPATIGYVAKDGPADKAGLQDGDVIVQIDDQRDPKWEDVLLKEVAWAKKAMTVGYVRNGERRHTTVTPILDNRTGVGSAGWEERNVVQVGGIRSGYDAGKRGLQRGDVFVRINGEPIHSLSKLHDAIKASKGEPVALTFRRNDKEFETPVTPSWSEADSRWLIGVDLERPVIITQLAFPDAVRESVRQNIKSAGLIYQFLECLIERRMSAKSLEGPIGIARLSGDAAREGPTAFFGLMAMVSLNLAVFNLLPIPILDGGMILMLAIEILMRRDMSMQFKEAIFKVGMVFLMAVVMFVLYNDISKLLPG